MRKNQYEITDSKVIEEILSKSEICRLHGLNKTFHIGSDTVNLVVTGHIQGFHILTTKTDTHREGWEIDHTNIGTF